MEIELEDKNIVQIHGEAGGIEHTDNNLNSRLREDQLSFMHKVLRIVFYEALITAAVLYRVITDKPTSLYLENNIWVFIMSLVAFLVLILVIFGKKEFSRKVPWNYVYATVLTFTVAVSLAYICMDEDPNAIITASILTVGIMLALWLLALVIKNLQPSTSPINTIIFLGSLLTMFCWIYNPPDEGFSLLLCFLVVVVYGSFIIIDLSLIIDDGRYNLTMDDYIRASIIIYLNLVPLFVRSLVQLGKNKQLQGI